MFRRIQLINDNPNPSIKEDNRYCIHGIMGFSHIEIADAWTPYLNGACGGAGNVPSNARFYFTELGWELIGKNVVAACQKHNQRYRVISVKENSVNVVWEDKHYGYEVACQPKK